MPVVPFFLINIGMLPGTCVYVYTGRAFATINSFKDIVSPSVLIALALLGVAPLLFRKLVSWIGRERASK